MKTPLKRELITWVQYFAIMFITATAAMYIQESARARIEKQNWDRHLAENAQAISDGDMVVEQAIAINLNGMLLDLWRGYYRWWIGVFVGLSALRLLIVLALGKVKRRMV